MPTSLTDSATQTFGKVLSPLATNQLIGTLTEIGIRNEARTGAGRTSWLRPAEKLPVSNASRPGGAAKNVPPWQMRISCGRASHARRSTGTSADRNRARAAVDQRLDRQRRHLAVGVAGRPGISLPRHPYRQPRHRMVAYRPCPFTVADMADDAYDVLTACGINRASVIGLSMGGMISQELAIRHPEVVDERSCAAPDHRPQTTSCPICR